MAADGGSWMERSGRRFKRLQEEANGRRRSFWSSLITNRRRFRKKRRSDPCEESSEKFC
jgi:hypothetical protein